VSLTILPVCNHDRHGVEADVDVIEAMPRQEGLRHGLDLPLLGPRDGLLRAPAALADTSLRSTKATRSPRRVFAEDHVAVALRQDIFLEQELLDRRHEAALHKNGLAGSPRTTQQRVVLHVASTDLNDAGVLCHKVDAIGVEGFGKPPSGPYLPVRGRGALGQPVPDLGTNTVTSAAGRPDPEDGRAQLLQAMGDVQDLLPAFHRTGPGHDHNIGAVGQ